MEMPAAVPVVLELLTECENKDPEVDGYPSNPRQRLDWADLRAQVEVLGKDADGAWLLSLTQRETKKQLTHHEGSAQEAWRRGRRERLYDWEIVREFHPKLASDSINALQFSADGSILALGGRHGHAPQRA